MPLRQYLRLEFAPQGSPWVAPVAANTAPRGKSVDLRRATSNRHQRIDLKPMTFQTVSNWRCMILLTVSTLPRDRRSLCSCRQHLAAAPQASCQLPGALKREWGKSHPLVQRTPCLVATSGLGVLVVGTRGIQCLPNHGDREMRKSKIFRRTYFSVEVLREATEAFGRLLPPIDGNPDYEFDTLEVHVSDERWNYDTFGEFLSDYRKATYAVLEVIGPAHLYKHKLQVQFVLRTGS